MKPAVKAVLIFVAGAFVGMVVTDYANRYLGQTVQEAQQLMSLVQAQQEAEAAYFHRSPEIAEWELTKLIPRLEIPAKPPLYSENDRSFGLLVAHARLAKVQQAQGKQAEAEQNLAAAREFAHALNPNYPADGSDPVAALEAFDKNPNLK